MTEQQIRGVISTLRIAVFSMIQRERGALSPLGQINAELKELSEFTILALCETGTIKNEETDSKE